MNTLSLNQIENILGRKQHSNLANLDGKDLQYKRILITGSAGSLGQALIERLKQFDGEILETDIVEGYENLDVTNQKSVLDL